MTAGDVGASTGLEEEARTRPTGLERVWRTEGWNESKALFP